jgi:glycogen(starch) synthase
MTGNKSFKVLMTADTVGGVWTYCVELCRSMQAYNVKFYVVTAGAKLNPSQKNEAAALENVFIYETNYKLEWMQDPWNDIDESAQYLLRLEKEIQPDLIHLNSYSYGSLNFKAPKIVVAHSDVYSWWMAVKKDYPTAEWHQYFKRVKDGLQNADLIIAPSLAAMDDIKTVYGIYNENFVIYNGRNPELFYQQEKLPYIISLGRIWDEAKNIKLLAAAAPQINYKIKIAGENNFENSSTNISKKNIEYTGKLDTDEIAKELSAASIFVLPAKYEPFGLSVLEAALSGCALVLGDVPSLREIWQDNALFVDPDDATALAETLNDLLENKEKLDYLSASAFSHAKKYSNSIVAKEYFKQYRQLILAKKYLKQTA